MGSPYSLANTPAPGPSLGAQTDFDLEAHQKAFNAMVDGTPEKEAARPVMKALEDGTIHPSELAGLAAQAQKAKDDAPAPQGALAPGASPYGVPGVPAAGPPTQAQAAAGQSGPPPVVQAGPPTQAQAAAADPMNQKIAQSQAAQAGLNKTATLAQFPGNFQGAGRLAPEAPVAPRSGLSTHDQLINDLKKVNTNVRPQGMSPEELAAQGAAISNLPAVARANQGLSDQENYLKMQMDQPRGPLSGDLGGFLAMLSHPGGPNLAEGYHAPETAAQQRTRILEALQKVQTDRQALAGNVIAGIKASKGGTLGDILTATDQLKQQQGAVDPLSGAGAGMEDRNNRYFLGAVQHDMKELQDANSSNQEAQRMLASGTSVLDTTFRDKFLKAMIGGRVTNYDLMRQSGDTALAERAQQVLSTMGSGTFSSTNRAEYQDALRVMAEATQYESNRRMADLREVGLNNLRLPPDRVEAGLALGGSSHMGPMDQPTLNASQKKSAAKVPEAYDGSFKLAHPNAEQKAKRLEYLQKKAGQ